MDQSFSERSNGPIEEELLPLPEDTLARNLGLDLIVVVTKVCNVLLLTQGRFLPNFSILYRMTV